MTLRRFADGWGLAAATVLLLIGAGFGWFWRAYQKQQTEIQALRQEMQRDGTYRVDTQGDSDIIVDGTIIHYDRRTLALQPRDALSPRDYRLVITAHIVARERVGGRILLDRNVQGHSNIRIGSDLASAEREALPLVAADLARNATALLVDGSW